MEDLLIKLSSLVSSSQLRQRIIFNWRTFLRLYQTFGNLDQDLLCTQGSLRTKTGLSPYRTWRHCHESGLDCESNILSLILTPASGQNSFTAFFPLWGAAPPEQNLGFCLWSIWRTCQHRGRNRLDEVKYETFQGISISNCIGSRLWWTGCGTWNVVSPSRLPKKYCYITFSKTNGKKPIWQIWDSAENPEIRYYYICTSFLILDFSEQHCHISSQLYRYSSTEAI